MSDIITKVNYPYIYFFIEHNVVFVYKIESDRYLTAADVREKGEWQTYEIKHPEEFETFHHEESEPLVGRGYCVNQETNNTMVKKINEQIKKHQKPVSPSPVHLVISESAAGSLKVGLERPKVVIGFPDFFSIGPVWRLHEEIGQNYRFEWHYENINNEQKDFEFENKFTNTLLEIEDIPEDVPIYIWNGNNASEQTGIRFLLHLLREKTNDIFLLNPTELHEEYIYTSQMHPENLRFTYEKGKEFKPLSKEERNQFQKEWQTLSQTKEVLRIWSNNEIKGVPEDYYDQLIKETIEKMHNQQVSKDFIKTGRVVGEILGQMEEVISFTYLEYRIRHLVYTGVLELKGIPKSMRHYSVKLRK